MDLKEFKPREISLYENFVGFPSIHKELCDIVGYLKYLNKLTKDGNHEHKKMLIQAESGSLFLGRTGTGKTYALHCIANEAKKEDYFLIDGKTMLQKKETEPKDVIDFFDQCARVAKEKPLLIAYDDARQLLGSRTPGRFEMIPREPKPMLEEFRRQIDRLIDFNHPAYIIITSVARTRNIDSQIARRFSRHLILPRPREESRKELFNYYISRFGYKPVNVDIITLSYLTDGVVAGKVEEIVSKASYKASMEGKLTNKLLVGEIKRFFHGPPVDTFLTTEMKIQTGYHEFGGHTLPSYLVGLEPILVTIEPSADGTFGRSVHRPSKMIPLSSSKHFFAEVVTRMGSTAVYTELKKGKEEGRLHDLVTAKRSALDLYGLKNPTIRIPVGREETYLTKGLLSEKSKIEVEKEIEEIKNEALGLATEMIRNYKDVISAFVEDHLINKETMVRSEIITTINGMDVKHGSYYEPMCQVLEKLGFLV
ncbi:ATP-binding protein [Candidatus Bathyarchaeota archaeon]|nr:ATP-binding protein [Candidatus Bathyarchaeota archaeon]